MRKLKFILIIFLLFVIYIYVSFISLLPDKIFLINNENFKLRKLPGIDFAETIITNNSNEDNEKKSYSIEEKMRIGNTNITNIEIRILGNILLKNIEVVKIDEVKVVPVGKIIGLKLYTNGVLVVGMSEIEDKNNYMKKPYDSSDIKPGDTILEINEQIIEDIDGLKKVINESNGNKLNLKILRNGNIINTNIIPLEVENKKYQLGLWVKDAATGVGTMSFYEPTTKTFGILGHGIVDADTGNLININSGELVTAQVISLTKGEENIPGEIKGTIINSQMIGEIKKNTQFGVFGTLNNLTSLNIDTSRELKIANRDEIKEGDAQILCSINSSNVAKEYKIEIQKIYRENDYNNKSMLIKITDEELVKETGGIIRGLSGAPIIQNGKFVGAITNVLVSNPQIGYAVFADMMIRELKEVVD